MVLRYQRIEILTAYLLKCYLNMKVECRVTDIPSNQKDAVTDLDLTGTSTKTCDFILILCPTFGVLREC